MKFNHDKKDKLKQLRKSSLSNILKKDRRLRVNKEYDDLITLLS